MRSVSVGHKIEVKDIKSVSVAGSLGLGSIIAIFLALFGPNLLESIVSLITFLIVFHLFYKPGIPNIMLIALLFQWTQISIKVWYGNIVGSEINDLYGLYKSDAYMSSAFYLSSIGLVFLSLGIHSVTRTIKPQQFYERITYELRFYDSKRIVIGYVLVALGLSFLFGIRLIIPGLNTLIVALGKIKWGFYVLFLFTAVTTGKYVRLFLLITLLEVVLSLTGYFSGFKDFIIFSIIGLISFTRLLDLKRIVIFVPSVILIFYFGAIWSAVKGDYRAFLSGGTDQQRVVVSQQEALDYLWNRLESVDANQVKVGVDMLVDRVSFIDLFSLALNHVPEVQSHENGKIWLNSITHFLKPRLFFPDKPVIDDSEHTSKYTGIYLADSSQGASHSIGFMADSYIDYGPVMMFVPIFFLGIIIGLLFKYFLLKSYNAIWGLIYTVPFYLLVSFYSFNLIKVIGNLLIYVVLLFFIHKRLAKIIDPYLRLKRLSQ
jgi:hypothetical protein